MASHQEPNFRAADAPARLRAALDRTFEAVLVTRPDWTVDYVNAAFERLTGLPADQVVDRPHLPHLPTRTSDGSPYPRSVFQIMSQGCDTGGFQSRG